MLGVTYTLTFYAKYRDRERRAAVLDVKLAQTQMQVLKAQLHPHFLFNTLHAVSAMIHADPDVADRMIARLGDFLRLTLRHGNAARVTLREELECIEAYLEVEQVRLGARLRVRVEVDPAVLETPVPNFLLQPLVENAVHHGIAPHPSAGRLDLRAYRGGDVLRLEVEDDGPGLANGHPTKQGIGLSNTRARLRRMYGPGHRFDLERGSLGGLRVVLEVPLAEELADSGWPAG
jgi:LytS/YehU family sensor histidine kinase